MTRSRSITIETEEDIARGVRSLRRRCTVLREVYKVTGQPPLRRREPGLAGLVRIIVGQQVSVASANAIWQRCADTLVPMSAARIADASDDELRACGLSRPKIRTLRAVADAISSDALNLEGAADIQDREMREALLNVMGVGPWTADVFQLFCLGRRDAFAPGDLALQVAAQHAFKLDVRPTPEQLDELAQPWRPWRGVAARLLWAYYAAIKDGRSGIGV